MLIVDDGVLALLYKELDKVAKILTKLFPKLPSRYKGILPGLFVEFLSHDANDVGVFHIGLHLSGDSSFTP